MSNNRQLFLLRRDISHYSGEDLFLGIYNDIALATRQKDRYCEDRKTHDMWAKQAYKEVDLMKDVELTKVEEKLLETASTIDGQTLYLVSGIWDISGGISKTLEFISTNEQTVEAFIREKEEDENPGEDDYSYYKYDVLELNSLSFTEEPPEYKWS